MYSSHIFIKRFCLHKSMEKKDWCIISQLRSDARKPVSTISNTVHLCREAVAKRIEKYTPIIRKYTVLLDFQKIGLVHVLMNVSVSEEKEIFEKYIQQHHGLNTFYQTSNGYAIEMVFQNAFEADEFVNALTCAFAIQEKHVWVIEKQLAQECFLENMRSIHG